MIDGTLETIDGRPALRFERRLRHPRERVWRAVTEPGELARWFVAPASWTPALGERFGPAQEGEIVALQPPERIAWTWDGQRFEFALRADGDGCVLTFTHVFDAGSGPAAQHAAGWEAYLARLAALLRGGELTEERAHEPIGELHERYAARFEQDPGPGRRMIARMAFRGLTRSGERTVRLERRYRHPAERIWRAISDPSELAAWFPEPDRIEVVRSEPPRRLELRWHGEALRLELMSDDEGCVLVFEHDVAEPDAVARTAAGWDRCFARLDADLAGVGMSDAESLALWPEVHERYAAAFGVDPEVGRRAYAARVG